MIQEGVLLLYSEGASKLVQATMGRVAGVTVAAALLRQLYLSKMAWVRV